LEVDQPLHQMTQTERNIHIADYISSRHRGKTQLHKVPAITPNENTEMELT